ncbi:MAG: DUF4920 domain-containing protein [Holophagaceae bacterium]|nr:DUF4920 domain-containing protein [Holophagaceae bacterium]
MFRTLALSLVAVAAFAGGKAYGKPLALKEATAVSAILANPAAFQGRKVQVRGMVVDVCKKRGCWMELASDKKYETLTFKVEDVVIVIPVDAKGSQAVAEGVIQVSKDEKGKTVVRLMGEGAVIQ